jgi:saccharopine dehydrogenase-like NADP-dependent oxidoreductase
VLGAMGKMCCSTVLDLSRNSDFSEIVLADLDKARLETLVDVLDDRRLSCVGFDARDIDSIQLAMRECDIVVDGLPGTFAPKVLRAAMAEDIDFVVSINPPTLDGKLTADSWAMSDSAYREAGLGVTMAGGQPVVESLATLAAAEMSRVHEINVAWAMSRPFNYGSPGLVDIVLHEEDPNVDGRAYYADGSLIEGLAPFAMARTWDFEEAIQRECGSEIYAQTHADPYFLPAAFPDANLITSRGTWRRETNEFLRFLNRHGLYDAGPINVRGNAIKPIDFIRDLWVEICRREEARIASGQEPIAEWGECVLEVEAVGVKDGIAARSVFSCAPPSHPWHKWFERDPVGDYGVYVGVPASIVAIMLSMPEISVEVGLFRAAQIVGSTQTFANMFRDAVHERGFSFYRRV